VLFSIIFGTLSLPINSVSDNATGDGIEPRMSVVKTNKLIMPERNEGIGMTVIIIIIIYLLRPRAAQHNITITNT